MKIDVIRNNTHKYSVSAMCKVLQIPRSTYYYESKERDNQEEELTNLVVQIFKNRRNIYGQRKIKVEIKKIVWQIKRRRSDRIITKQEIRRTNAFSCLNL